MGEIAALITALCWVFAAIFFSQAGRVLGSMIVNRMRLVFAVILLVIAHWLTLGQPVPIGAGWERWMWLGLSGFIGLVLGDLAWFKSLVLIGPRLAMLITAATPVMSALLAWLFLGETLGELEIVGILVTTLGISLVVMEGDTNGNGTAKEKRAYLLGVLAGVAGALGQAGGMILSKKGLEGDFPTISGVLMRAIVAFIILWLLALATRQARPTLQRSFENPLALRSTMLGAVVGPFIGVWLSLVAIQYTHVGIASTLMSLSPVMMLFISGVFYKEKISILAIFGTLLSMAGVVMLILR